MLPGGDQSAGVLRLAVGGRVWQGPLVQPALGQEVVPPASVGEKGGTIHEEREIRSVPRQTFAGCRLSSGDVP